MRVVEDVAETGFFIKLWAIEIDRFLQVPGKFFLRGMASATDDPSESFQVFVFESLKLAADEISLAIGGKVPTK